MAKRTTRPKTQLDLIADKMLDSYTREPRTRRVDCTFMPSRPEAQEILHLCFQILFPGYFGSVNLTRENIRFHIGGLLATLERRLSEQVFRCLCYNGSRGVRGRRLQDPEAFRSEARKVTRKFLGKLPAVRDRLDEDVQAAYDGDPAAKSFDEIIFCYPGFHAIMIYRLAHELHGLGVRLLPRIMSEYAHTVTGVDIHPGATIGKRFFIDHATGVVIGETSVIGNNVKIYQGVTLGALSFPKDQRGRVIRGYKRHPTLRDNVTVYANATILGGKTVIGKGVTVGGNTFVTASVTADSLIAARPQPLRTLPKKRPG